MGNKKRNIAIIVPTLRGGGAERVASNLSLYLSEQKYRKYIILNDAEKIEYPYNGTLIDLKTKAINNPFGKIFNLIRRIYKLKKIKRKLNIQTSISFLEAANIVNIFSKTEDKIIVSIRSFKSKNSAGFYGRVYNYLIKKYYSQADIFIAVSKGVKNDLIKNYGIKENKIKVIYNFYDIKKIRDLAKENIEDKYKNIFNNPVIINMGRLSKPKGQWHLIRAFKKIKEKIPRLKLIFLGEGELEEYLKKLARELEIGKDVYFLGFHENPFKFISRSKIFVFPSLYEGFPNALVEAMICRIPVIASDCKSGPREILAPETNIDVETKIIEYAKYGILIPVCDNNCYGAKEPLTNEETILANIIINLYQNKKIQEEYAAKAKKRVEDFKAEKLISEYEDILNVNE